MLSNYFYVALALSADLNRKHLVLAAAYGGGNSGAGFL